MFYEIFFLKIVWNIGFQRDSGRFLYDMYESLNRGQFRGGSFFNRGSFFRGLFFRGVFFRGFFFRDDRDRGGYFIGQRRFLNMDFRGGGFFMKRVRFSGMFFRGFMWR